MKKKIMWKKDFSVHKNFNIKSILTRYPVISSSSGVVHATRRLSEPTRRVTRKLDGVISVGATPDELSNGNFCSCFEVLTFEEKSEDWLIAFIPVLVSGKPDKDIGWWLYGGLLNEWLEHAEDSLDFDENVDRLNIGWEVFCNIIT